MLVENAEVTADLITSSPSKPSKYARSKHIAPKSGSNLDSAPPITLLRKEEHDDSHLRALAAQKARKEKEFPLLLERIDKATDALNSIDHELQLADEAKRNKIRRQFEEWNSNVHGTIQKKIAQSIDSLDKKELNKKKNRDYDKFLQVTNRKPAIFRDIIIESEYDPLEPNRNCIKARTHKLNDPPKLGLQKAEREASMLGSASGSRKKEPLGKDTLNVELWASGQIEATPYGIFSKMMNKPRTGGFQDDALSSSNKSATLKSHIVFDHFDFPKGKDAIEPEMPRGKRIYPEVVYTDPSRIFGNLPPHVEQEVAAIRPPENRRSW